MIVFWNIFCQLDKNGLGIYKSITRNVASQEDDYTAGCLIDFYIWKKKKINSHKQTTSTWSWYNRLVSLGEYNKIFFILEEGKETVSNFL